jgi:hypothetical protein
LRAIAHTAVRLRFGRGEITAEVKVAELDLHAATPQ